MNIQVSWPALAGLLVLLRLGSAAATVVTEAGSALQPTINSLSPGDPLLAAGRGRAGDFRLEYGTLAFVVGQASGARDPREGSLLEVAALYPSPRPLGLSRITPLCGSSEEALAPPVFLKSSVSRSRDLATLRLEGYDPEDSARQVVVEYQVGPAVGEGVRVVTTVLAPAGRGARIFSLGDDVRLGALARFAPGAGFQVPRSAPLASGRGLLPYLQGLDLSAGGEGESLLYLPRSSAQSGVGVSALAGVAGSHGPRSSRVAAAVVELAPGGQLSYTRDVVVAADPARRLCGSGARPVNGLIVEERSAEPLRAVVILADAGGAALSATRSGERGRFALCGPAGPALRLRAEAPGRGGPALVLPAGREALQSTLQLSRPARLRALLREAPVGRHGPRPALALLQIRALPGTSLPTALGGLVAEEGGGALLAQRDALWAYSDVDEVELALPPGRYHLQAQRGPFWEQGSQEVELKAGETRKTTVTLRRGLPVEDVADLRCTELALRDAVEAPLLARAVGLDALLVPAGSASGVSGERRGARGGRHLRSEALSPLALVPALSLHGPGARLLFLPRPAAPAVDPRGYPTLATLVGALHQGGGSLVALTPDSDEGLAKLLQGVPYDLLLLSPAAVLGPRSGGLNGALALSGRIPSVNFGVAAAADSLPGEPGALRACYGRTQAVRALSLADELRVALQRGDLQMTNGPLLRVQVNGAGAGQTASALDGRVRVSIRVLAAPFVDVKDVVVLMASRGAVREALRHGVPAATTAQRYFSEVSLPVGEDAALVVVARGERPLDAQRADSRPLAISAPIYIDRDGDGKVFGR